MRCKGQHHADDEIDTGTGAREHGAHCKSTNEALIGRISVARRAGERCCDGPALVGFGARQPGWLEQRAKRMTCQRAAYSALLEYRPVQLPCRWCCRLAIESAGCWKSGFRLCMFACAGFYYAEVEEMAYRRTARCPLDKISQMRGGSAFEKEIAACRQVEADRSRAELAVPDMATKTIG